MKRKEKNKPAIIKVKKQKPAIDPIIGTIKTSSKEETNTPRYRLSNLNLKEEGLGNNKFIRKIENNDEIQTISTLARASQIYDDTFNTAGCISIEVRQEVTTKPEILLNEIPGRYSRN